jgi:hypothetical protein
MKRSLSVFSSAKAPGTSNHSELLNNMMMMFTEMVSMTGQRPLNPSISEMSLGFPV